mmetsp:Transcript_17559/g.54884  ORF Transcript_17559/g.54884 Transcript_17559/m.54884 type:complete len:364 (+) Transcript_17559:1161-2252(+)
MSVFEQHGLYPSLFLPVRAALRAEAHAAVDQVMAAGVPSSRLNFDSHSATRNTVCPINICNCDVESVGQCSPDSAVEPQKDGRSSLFVQHEQFEDTLCKLYIYTSTDPVLFIKISRMTRIMFLHMSTTQHRIHMQSTTPFRLVKNLLMPSLSLVPCNPGLVMEMWASIQALPYRDRHVLYSARHRCGSTNDTRQHQQLELTRAECCACYEVKQALKRLANEKKSSKQVGRQLAKIAHSNPVVLFDVLLTQVEAYDNMIHPLMDAFGFMTPLALDVLASLLPIRLSATVRPQLQFDGMNVAHWFQHLAQFTGALYRAYPATELRSLIDFVFSRCYTSLSTWHNLHNIPVCARVIRSIYWFSMSC